MKARLDARGQAAAGALKAALARLSAGEATLFANAPEGFDAFVAGDLARALAEKAEGQAAVFVHVARDPVRSARFREALRFSAPFVEILDLPGWDCQPYDRVSPSAAVASRRMTALARLARSKSSAQQPRVSRRRWTVCCSACRRAKKLPPTLFPPRRETSSRWIR